MGEGGWKPFVYGGLASCTAEFAAKLLISPSNEMLFIRSCSEEITVNKFKLPYVMVDRNRYLSTDNTFYDLQFKFYIARPAIGVMVKAMAKQAIWLYMMKEMERREPTEEMRRLVIMWKNEILLADKVPLMGMRCLAVYEHLQQNQKRSTFPIDTTKTRLQIQGQKTDSKYAELKYRGMTHALLQISKQEGVRALYSGIGPAVLRQATYGTIKFGTYYSLKHLTVKANGEEDVALNVCCAVVAGMVSSAIANPTDVLKVRMQVLGTQSSRGIVGCFQEVYHHEGVAGLWREVYHHEGVAGLWRGVGPTSQRAAVIAAVELPVYDFCKQHLMTTFGDRVSNHFISSFIASLGSAVASTPIDVVRTRLMNQRKLKTTSGGASTLHIYSGSVDCLAQTVKNEGLLALYKGFIPTWVRMGPWNIIFFVTYEQLKKFY
uniref:(California timema) hypothetical protein n=1 Tax=Timema californicum TaxID=61474 RepID=A0A7R9J286_TIMCA|nr:unnamed protein product [Timema californicum]